ncbi:uncharacterized protein LOC106150375 [Lingula anatina]|uniref:Uncharacterized protein LOC106150375 n=1 Tax=Lingula anatina TaxID=7574 RepID=A0A1S3GXV8_LINAN|nr:uncharacterized protein LOC106150375 [Lingula anatina]|eukprot:XP_013378583.1 uncharacterized protein LOC106150375 [Lingula anatina]
MQSSSSDTSAYNRVAGWPKKNLDVSFHGTPPKPQKCIFLNTPSGCRHGENCKYLHTVPQASVQMTGSPEDEVKLKTTLTCGECQTTVHSIFGASAWEQLLNHYVEKLSAKEREHVRLFDTCPLFVHKDAICAICGHFFKCSLDCLAHIGSKARQGKNSKKRGEYLELLQNIAYCFIERDAGVCDEDTLKKSLSRCLVGGEKCNEVQSRRRERRQLSLPLLMSKLQECCNNSLEDWREDQ